MFAACRAGQVSVIVGSTQKMGVGTNIQARAIALHHVDVPWRPADVAQRDGRIMRQGNQNPTVGIYRYVTEGSFDTYMWQTVERKARFINQLMRGRLDVREIEDVGEDVIGFAELKAIASGDPLILEKAKIDAEVERLGRVQRAWQRGHHALRSTITAGEERVGVRERQLAAVNQALPRVRDTRGDLFSMTIDGHSYTQRTDAARALAASLRSVARGPARPVAQLAGLQVDAELLGDHDRRAIPAPHPSGPPGAARDAQTLPARGRRPVADPPARASRPHAPRTRRPARQRARGRGARERRGARAARTAVQVRRAARRRAPPPRTPRRADRRAATTTSRTASAQPRSPASTPTPPPRSRSRTAPIPSQPRPRLNPPPPPCPPPSPTTASRQLLASVTWSRRPPSRCGCCAPRRPSRSRKRCAPRPRSTRRRRIAPAHRRGPPGPAGKTALCRARAGRSPCPSGFWLAPYGGGAGECCVAELDVQRLVAVGVKERLELRGVLEQAGARVRRAGHAAQDAL